MCSRSAEFCLTGQLPRAREVSLLVAWDVGFVKGASFPARARCHGTKKPRLPKQAGRGDRGGLTKALCHSFWQLLAFRRVS